jgi:hypothetical protein
MGMAEQLAQKKKLELVEEFRVNLQKSFVELKDRYDLHNAEIKKSRKQGDEYRKLVRV